MFANASRRDGDGTVSQAGGSGQEAASPFSMSEGDKTTLAAGRDEDSGWGVYTIPMIWQNHTYEILKPS